jgi:hypothetical protein
MTDLPAETRLEVFQDAPEDPETLTFVEPDGDERYTHWITIDIDAAVALEEMI